jgi:hypothetical protein
MSKQTEQKAYPDLHLKKTLLFGYDRLDVHKKMEALSAYYEAYIDGLEQSYESQLQKLRNKERESD